MNLKAALASAGKNIERSYIEVSPFQHYLLAEAFPPDLYQKMLENLPADEAYSWGEMTQAAERSRGLFVLNNDSLSRLPNEQKEFWSTIKHWLTSNDFAELILKKFDSNVTRRLSSSTDTVTLFAEAKLVRDRTPYALEPHTDAPNRVTTLMFYLPRDNSIADLGTAIYRPKLTGQTCEGNRRHSFDQFELVGKAPFSPNTGMGFLKSDHSFHGVEPIEEVGAQRDILTFSIRHLEESFLQKAKRRYLKHYGREQNTLVSTSYA